jgi:hypothetical protein
MRIIIIIISLLSFLLSERGDLISYEFKGSKLASDVQLELESSDAGQLNPNAIYNIDLYSIIYETINQFGEVAQASGSISIPSVDDSAFPIYLFGHGTEIRRAGAPSMSGFNVLNMWVSTSGYIYIEPDYLGLGISQGLHPYHLKDVTASTMIDMIYASKSLCNNLNNIQFNNQLFIAGYSEGGYAAMATVKEIEENYSNELNITMSFPMAGAYDLSGTMADLMLSEEEYEDPFYLPFFILSYIEKYDLGPIDSFFKEQYAVNLLEWFSGEHSGGYINDFLPNIPIHMLKDDLVAQFQNNPNFEFRLRLEENNLLNWVPISTMYLFHGLVDERVPVENTNIAYASFNGAENENIYVEILPENYGGHQEAAPYCLIQAFNISEGVKIIHNKGDLNNDQICNISDIVLLLNKILGANFDGDLDVWISDINNDNLNNIFDIILLVEKILTSS